VLDVMRNCDSLDSRQQVMQAVIKSSDKVSTCGRPAAAAHAVFIKRYLEA
jgi:hypothetical protein